MRHSSGPGSVADHRVAGEGLAAEVARLDQALRRAIRELQGLRSSVQARAGEEVAAIFDAHLSMLEHGQFVERIRGRIRGEGVNAERALRCRGPQEVREHLRHLSYATPRADE